MPTEETAIEVVESPITLFGTSDPAVVVEKASAIATVLADVIKQRKLYKQIGAKPHVFLEGWTLLGSMLGVFAVVEWSREIDDGFEARVTARTRHGDIVGAAEAQCTRLENKWADRDEYAIRSMAQSRAASKALRLPLGFVMQLAGYEATPAEEMTEEPAPPTSPIITREMVEQRVIERAEQHAIPREVLDELIGHEYPGHTLSTLAKDDLLQLGTDITHGRYNVPFEQRETTGEPGAPTENPVVGSDTGAMTQPPVLRPTELAPEAPSAEPTIQAVLDLTGGELVKPDPIAERVERAKKRAKVTP